MTTLDTQNVITLLATLGVDARPTDRSVQIDRFEQWVDDDRTSMTMGSTMCLTSRSLAEALV
ncbi:hypothetical protein [Alloactinosynnema sp. L-07]|uniref:hypothetical protein n=1 Tax=Alloactinosynnema sp. L-07 TaxID=1653480 RepID=UPI00065EFEB7|nr:hypothetical protein [Alloactinosynnema sp. L-07]CRK57520.1 hypothetical protein [Alloactinosynnema sp. L-07]